MGIFSDPDHLGDLPESNKPTDGIGIIINLTGKRRWRPFATWIIKLLSRCLTEETLYVEGLIQSVSTILSEDKEGLPVFRYVLRCLKLVDLCW
jgi:hypothetical protein